MVIICPECTTKFRVAPDRIPDCGAKVRCARCKHIFWAEKTKAEEPQIEAEGPQEELQTEIAPDKEAVNDTTNEELNAETTEIAPSEESGFDYDQFRDQDSSKEESFAFSTDTTEQPSGTAEQATPETEDGSFSFGDLGDKIDSQEAQKVAAKDKNSTADGEETDADPLTITEPPKEETPPPANTEKTKPGAISSIIRMLLLLILGILILGGILLYMNGPEQLEQVFQQLMGQQLEYPEEQGQIVLNELQGKFISNQDAGELFIIRGEAINKFSAPRASIQVKGVIFDQNGKALLQKTIFCGNPISDLELQELPFTKIEELMGNQFGKSLSNMNVNKNQAIPFVIVFRDLPQSLAEFSADITSSKPATP